MIQLQKQTCWDHSIFLELCMLLLADWLQKQLNRDSVKCYDRATKPGHVVSNKAVTNNISINIFEKNALIYVFLCFFFIIKPS